MQQHTEQLIQIFSRLVAAKITDSLSESAGAYSDLNTLADHFAITQEHDGSAALRPRYGPVRAGLKAPPVSDPMRMPATISPIATSARWAGRPAPAVLAYLARMGAGLGLWGVMITWLSLTRNHKGVRAQG
jgi:hypothetical protein